jgi:17beta-estradiol 17-dehydrogenase / very-long-chain 3-oxoacyl-CoA reductase
MVNALSHSYLVHLLVRHKRAIKCPPLITLLLIGIGNALAFELAALNFNLIIHARTIAELTPVKEEMIQKHPDIEVICIAQDASVQFDWSELMDQLKGRRITVLINNVAVALPVPFNVLEAAPDDAIEATIRVNTIFPTQLTRNLLPTLIENSPSIILNICSGSIYVPPPFISIYTGTKAYNLIWSKALYNELRLLRRDVACKAVMTAAVQSEGNTIPTSTFVPTSQEYARSLLARAGSSGPMYNGYWRHTIQVSCTLNKLIHVLTDDHR